MFAFQCNLICSYDELFCFWIHILLWRFIFAFWSYIILWPVIQTSFATLGEDRWMCTLMMKAGWTLRYSYHGKNTTFCPEETEEFMKQRRRWLLSDFANAAVTIGNLCEWMPVNNCFSYVVLPFWDSRSWDCQKRCAFNVSFFFNELNIYVWRMARLFNGKSSRDPIAKHLNDSYISYTYNILQYISKIQQCCQITTWSMLRRLSFDGWNTMYI